MLEIFECSKKEIINNRIRLTFVKQQERLTSESSASEGLMVEKLFIFRGGNTSKFVWFKNGLPFSDYKVGDKFKINSEELKSFHYLSNIKEEVVTKINDENEVTGEIEIDIDSKDSPKTSERGEGEDVAVERVLLQESSSSREEIENLCVAVKKNNVDEVRKILRSYPEIVNTHDKNENYALHYAVADGNEKITKMLLEVKGININVKNVRNLTALHIAIANAEENNYKKITELLLEEESIDLENKNSYGNTPLHYAAEKGNWELLEKLLKKFQERKENIDISEIKNTFGWTLLHSVVSGVLENEEQEHWDVIEELLKDKRFKFSDEQILSVEDLLEEDEEKLKKYREVSSKYLSNTKEKSVEEESEREFKILMISVKKPSN